jgi:hypothetical protein
MPRLRAPAAVFEALVARVTRGPGVTSVQMRTGAAGADGVGLPAAVIPVIQKIRNHAYKVTDDDIAALRAAGLDDEAIFELTVAAAVGTAARRLDAAMEVIDATR